MPKVFVVNRPIRNKFGWTPDLSDASRYGSIEVVFEPDDNPQFVPSPMIMKAKKDYERLLARGLHSLARRRRPNSSDDSMHDC